jgi:hypothetical protein
MLEDLFLTETPGETSSSNVELPEDLEQWPAEIQNILYTQIPELANIPGQLNFDTVEQDKRYAKGTYTVDTGSSNDGNNIIFPILVKDGELLPMDVYLYKDEFRPVDSNDIASILMSPEIGDETIDEQDIPASTYSDFSNRINPPGAYGSGYVTSYKTGALNEKLLDMVEKDASIKKKLFLNKVAQKHFINFFDRENVKVAEKPETRFPVDGTAIFALGNDTFVLKSASLINGNFNSQEAEVDFDTLKNMIKSASLNLSKIVNDLKSTGMSIVSSEREKTAADGNFGEITDTGTYSVINRSSMKEEPVDVVGYVKTASGENRYLAISSDGHYALQRNLYGAKATTTKEASFKFASLKPGETITLQISDDSEFASPVKITSVTGFKTAEMAGTSVNGRSLNGNTAFIFLKNAGISKPVKAGFVPASCFIEKGAEAWFVPENYPVLSLTKEEHYIKTADDKNYSQFIANNGRHSTIPVDMWKVTDDKVALKVGGKNPEFIDKTSALLLISKYDSAQSACTEMRKIAEGKIKRILVDNKDKDKDKKESKREHTRDVKPLTDKQRRSILKVAASLDDGESIDDVLQLNYVNPGNLEEFKENIPELKATENMLAKLLLSTRLGNTTVDEGDVQSVLGSLHDIIRALDSRV